MPEPISREGYDKIKEEIRRLEQEEMPKIAEKIAEARAEGDLRENAEYHGQRENQGMLQAKINQLKAKLANCTIVDKSAMPKDKVAFGCTVTVKDLDKGYEDKYQLVGPGEEDYSSDIMKILTSSPIGQALVGRKIGDKTELTLPRGKQRLEVTAIDWE